MLMVTVCIRPRFPVTKGSCKVLTSQTSENSLKYLLLCLLVPLTNITFALIISFTHKC